MPGISDNTVAITIQVVDSSGPALQQAEARLGGLGAAAEAAAPKLQLIQGGFSGIGGAASTGMGEAAAATENLHGHMRELSGTARELGINLPYSMKAFLAESPAVIAGLRAMTGLFVGMAAIEIGTQIIEGVHRLYEEWFDTSKAVEAYKEKAGEAAEQKLFNTASLEEGVRLLTEANAQVAELQAKRDNGATYDITGFENINGPSGESPFTVKDDAAQAKAMEQADKIAEHNRQTQQGLDEQNLKGQAAYDSAVTQGYAHIAAHEKDTIAEINQRYDQMRQQEANLVKIHNDGYNAMMAAGKDMTGQSLESTDPNAFNQQRQAAITAAQQEAAGQRVALARSEQTQIIAAQNEAYNARVQGLQLIQHQEEQAIAAVVRKFNEGEISKQSMLAITAALEQKYSAEIDKAIDDQNERIRKMQEHADQAGLTGLPRIQAEQQSQLSDLYGESHGDLGAMFRGAQAIQQETNQKMTEAQQTFTERIVQITQRADGQMTEGYARVAADEANSLNELQRAYTEFYGADQSKWQGYQDAKTAIEQNADRERLKFTQQTDEQITQMEVEAARATMPPWEAAQQKIIDDYALRVQKITAEVAEHVITEQQGAREVQAAWQLANADMERQTQQARDQMAGQLASFFDNPARYMEQRGKQVMFDILANWMQQMEESSPRLKGFLGGIFGENKVGTGSPQHALGQLFGARSTTQPGDTLAVAGTTLSSAGQTLQTSGGVLYQAAAALMQVAQTPGAGWGSSGGSGGGTMARFTGLSLPGAGGTGGAGFFGGSSTSSTGGEIASGISSASGIVPQVSSAFGAVPGGGMAGGISSTITQGMQLSQALQAASSSSGAALLNPGGVAGVGGGLQPSDLPPTSGSGVLGTVPGDTATGYGASGDAGGGMSATGGALAAIGGGLALYGGAESAYNASTFAGGLMGAASMGLTGAGIGMMFGGPIGAAIGAAAGFAAGVIVDLFGDRGASKMRQYNIDTVIPALQKDMDSFSFGGGDYDSASMDINNVELQAQQNAKQWGSGAMGVYTSTVMPEITNALAQVSREGAAGRSNVRFGVSQFHAGGEITDFGSLWTSPTTGMIHAELGETVMSRAASAMHRSTIDAANRGVLDLGAIAGPRPAGRAPSDSTPEQHLHVHIHALDVRDFKNFLRRGGAASIQGAINEYAGTYAGKALS